jgi:hypothetical protein
LFHQRQWGLLVVMSESQSTAGWQGQKAQRAVDGEIGTSVVNEETALLPGTSSHDQQANDHDEQESWNEPRINAYRFVSVVITLFNLGLNDACIGVRQPPPCLSDC